MMSFQFNSAASSSQHPFNASNPSSLLASAAPSSSSSTVVSVNANTNLPRNSLAPSPLKADFIMDDSDQLADFGAFQSPAGLTSDTFDANFAVELSQGASSLASPGPFGILDVHWENMFPVSRGSPLAVASQEMPSTSTLYPLEHESLMRELANPAGFVPGAIQDLAAHCELPAALPIPPLTRPEKSPCNSQGEVPPDHFLNLNEIIDEDCLTLRNSCSPSPVSEYLTTPVQSPEDLQLDFALSLFEDVPHWSQQTVTNIVPLDAPTPASPDIMPPPPLPAGKTEYTGTRKNVTSASLIALDAPVQPRNYSTSSATSRKEVPQSLKRKRTGNEDDIQDYIAKKRFQNTQAARRSRQRKMAYTENLEASKAAAEAERDLYKAEVIRWQQWAMAQGHNEAIIQISGPTLALISSQSWPSPSPSPPS